MSNDKIAVPSDNPGGLDARVSGHFGRCDRYTLVDIDQDGVKKVEILDNPPHQEGGCLAPVGLLADRGVTSLLAGGLGRRPLMGFQQAGIRVYFAGDQPTVGQAVAAFLAGRLPAFSLDAVCGGHGGGGGCGGH